MKVLVYSLLLVNFGVFAWFAWIVDDDEPSEVVTGFDIDESLPQLRLANEANGMPTVLTQAQQNAVDSIVTGDTQGTDGASSADSVGDDPIAATDFPGGGTDTIINNNGAEGVSSDTTAASLVTAVASQPLCVSLGPFQDDEFASAASDLLSQNGYTTTQRATDGQVRVGFWVNIVAGATRDDAQAMADQLRDRGVSDFYIVPGDESNVISLGVYSGQERAQRRFDELTTLDFQPSIDDRMQVGTVQWLDFSIADPALINPADFDAGSGLPVELVSRPCAANDAASG